jgi:hypothetical protein
MSMYSSVIGLICIIVESISPYVAHLLFWVRVTFVVVVKRFVIPVEEQKQRRVSVWLSVSHFSFSSFLFYVCLSVSHFSVSSFLFFCVCPLAMTDTRFHHLLFRSAASTTSSSYASNVTFTAFVYIYNAFGFMLAVYKVSIDGNGWISISN